MKAFYAVGFSIFILIIVFSVCYLIVQNKKHNSNKRKKNQIHVIIIATEPDKADQLLASLSTKKGYQVHVKGLGEQWTGYDFKLRHTLALAKTLDPNDILMHLDAYDTYVLTDASEILEKFFNMDANVVVSTETNLHPEAEFEKNMQAIENMYPTAPVSNRFRWINSGTYVGYAGALVNILSAMPPNFECDLPTGDKMTSSDDQRCFHTLFIKERDRHNIKLDYNQDIFHCMWGVQNYSLAPKRLMSETGSMPCILHGNGPNPPSYVDAVKNFKSRSN